MFAVTELDHLEEDLADTRTAAMRPSGSIAGVKAPRAKKLKTCAKIILNLPKVTTRT